jgi:hypothetical protein
MDWHAAYPDTLAAMRNRAGLEEQMTDLLQRSPLTPLHALAAPDETRRRLLMFGAGAASAAAAAPLVAATPGAVVAEPVAQPDAKGYSETQHVRDYYATARI